jgi:hypothetical protein
MSRDVYRGVCPSSFPPHAVLIEVVLSHTNLRRPATLSVFAISDAGATAATMFWDLVIVDQPAITVNTIALLLRPPGLSTRDAF